MLFNWYKLGVKRSRESLGFKINLGLELGLKPGIKDKISRTVGDRSIDYITASTNDIDGKKVYEDSFYAGKREEDIYRQYFEHVLNNIDEYGDMFDAYTKLDQVIRYNKKQRFNYNDYEELLDAIIEKLVNKDKGIEVYTGLCNDKYYLPSPYISILRKYKDKGGKIITLGSGAIKSSDLGKYFDYAYDVIESVGFDEIATYHKREPEFQKIKSIRSK